MAQRSVDVDKLRNIGIMAHIDAGKTTTTERILFYTGVLHRMGEVHEGTAFMDYMDQEKERGITITSAATTCFWKGYQINIIDTPGHVDFTAEVQRSLRVLDGAIALFDAVAGVEPQSETVWHQADGYKVPRIAYVNKMDRIGANYNRTMDMMRERLNARPLPIQMPIGEGDEFSGIVDLVRMVAYRFDEDSQGFDVIEVAIPDSHRAAAEDMRSQLVETAVESSDALLEKYLSGEEISHEELKGAIRSSCLGLYATPILCGSSFKNKGVQLLLDAVLDYLPSPADIAEVGGYEVEEHENALTRKTVDSEPFSGLAFKILTDQFVGRLTFVRIYSGSISVGDAVMNTSVGKRERVGRLLKMHANKREEIQTAYSGDIVAIPGLRVTRTGDTLCDQKHPILFEKIQFAEPVINQSIEAKTLADQDKLLDALGKLAEEDPTFRYYTDEESGQLIISGVGELHLEILVDRLKREFNVVTRVGKPQVAYRETIMSTARQEGLFERQAPNGKGQFARVVLELHPNERGAGFTFENQLGDERIPAQMLPAIEQGAREALNVGPIQGYPMLDVGVRLVDGAFDEAESTEVAFKIAASIAMKDGVRNAQPTLLEPVFEVEVVTPEEYVGDIIADLSSRRGRIEGISQRGILQVVRAAVPLSAMFGYVTQLRSMSQGRAVYTMVFSHYEPATVKSAY